MDPVIEPLASHHDRAAFSCGVPLLDGYIRQRGSQDVRRHVARCYILRERSSSAIAGYYTLSSTDLAARPLEQAKRLPRYPILLAALIGRLAMDLKLRGKRLGELLLVDALRRVLDTQAQIGIMAVVVDVLNENAVRFYEHFQFQHFVDSPHRLFLPTRKVQDMFR